MEETEEVARFFRNITTHAWHQIATCEKDGTCTPSSGLGLDPRVSQQILAASIGGTIVALVANPFDVLKTRLQAQITHKSTHKHATVSDAHFRSTGDALVKILRKEGVLALWTGLRPHLMMAIPSASIYFTAYENMKWRLDRRFKWDTQYSAMLAGGLARLLTATITSPLELIRTNLQARPRSSTDTISFMLRRIVQIGGWSRLWAGLPPTILRDVPFSAVYWSCYESFRSSKALVGHSTFTVSFVSGAGAGMLAALTTNPIDVVKTRRQMHIQADPSRPQTVLAIFRSIAREEGWGGFLKGIVPRAAKVAPACAIMISCYELCKRRFSDKWPS